MASRSRIPILVLTILALIAACVPPPVGRPSPSPVSPTTSPSSSVPAGPSGPTPLPSFVRPTPTPLPTFVVYLVQRGDTLSSIGRRFSTTALSIAYWNRDTYPSLDPESDGYAPDRIAAGWTLRIIPGTVIDGSDLPEPSAPAGPSGEPSPGTATAAPSTGASPVPGAGVSTVVRHGPRTVDTVALTFDMGGRLDPALDIMGWLVSHGVAATIFTTGQTGTTTADGQAVLEIVADHRELFDLGNHSWSHPDFRDLDDAAIRDQLDRTEAAILETVNVSTKPWFRPPYGGLDDQVPASVGAAGWDYTVLWDIDTIDWKPESDGGPTAAQIVEKVVSNAQGGSIVLMHLGGYDTLQALPDIVAGLQADGLEPVTLGEMFGVDD